MKVWYQNRRTKHKRLILEDTNSSNNEINHQDESQTSDSTTKHDEESDWNEDESSNQRFYLHLSTEPSIDKQQ